MSSQAPHTQTDSSRLSSAFQLCCDVRPEWKEELCKDTRVILSLLIHSSPSGCHVRGIEKKSEKKNVFVYLHCTWREIMWNEVFKLIKRQTHMQTAPLNSPPLPFFRSDSSTICATVVCILSFRFSTDVRKKKRQLLEMKHNKWRRVWSLSPAYQNTAVVPLRGVWSFHFLNDNVPFADEAVTLSTPDTICGRHHCPLAAPVSPAWTACQGTLATRQSLSAQQLVILQVGPWARLIVSLSKCSLKVL